MKSAIILVVTILGVCAEPPPPSYLPPQARNSFSNGYQSSNQFATRQQYGPPPATERQQYSAPPPQYGPPSDGYNYGRNQMDDDLAEPANYEFNYEVQASDESGAEFGHQETREDDFARGEYHVLLPDGRMQIVEYEADEEGFRPKIRYEETGYADARNQQGPY